MCASCAGYDHSQSCGNECADHHYVMDAELTRLACEEGEIFFRCTACGSAKLEEVANVAA